jgi:Domain of unknown function (DUF4277)
MASVIKDFGLMNRMNRHLVPDAQAVMTPGEAVAGMMLKGVGFAHRPWSFTPQLFANTPLDRWFREGIEAEMCNRFTLGRTLDAV